MLAASTQASPKTNDRDITERDFALLCGLFESRVMTLAHAAALYFAGSTEAAKKRTQKLKGYGLVTERPRPRQYDPSILFLTKRGFELLHRLRRISDYPAIGWETMEKRVRVSPLTLRHELDVMTVKAVTTVALRATGRHTVAEFSTWPRLFSFNSRRPSVGGYGRSVLISPDGFLRVHEDMRDGKDPIEHVFYLELDRSTETHGNLMGRAGGYVEHYRGGGMATRFGAPRAAFKDYPFRVLWIFRNAERRNNAAVALLRHRPPILKMMWLTTFGEINSDPLAEIWVRPIDYQSATKGTSFDPSRQSHDLVYRRQNEREEFIERTVIKQKLFANEHTRNEDRPSSLAGGSEQRWITLAVE